MQATNNSTSILDKSFQGDYSQNIETRNNPESKLNIPITFERTENPGW
jgi:hypothetical protein